MSDPITEVTLQEAILARLGATHVEVADVSGGCGQAFQATIVSPQFTGLNALKRHRLVNAALKEELASIHAWSARCMTPEQFSAATAT